ncbi:MAG: nitroreductase [Planctomycetota bacterium]|nr:MAG: nitroreductase [Planctomycetota bacterium]
MENSSRSLEAPVADQFPARWSPRAWKDRIPEPESLRSLFEAARWAPSCYNAQPWYFVYSADPEALPQFQQLLVEGNQAWANQAPVLGVAFARRRFEHNGKDNAWAQFDTGAACMALALQAHAQGLSVHFMAGFDANRAPEALGVDGEEYQAMAAFAIGYRGDPASLPEDLREREKPSGRKAWTEIAREWKP